jgi:hypothetical protein
MNKFGMCFVLLSFAILQGCGVPGFTLYDPKYYRQNSSVSARYSEHWRSRIDPTNPASPASASDVQVCKTASDQATKWNAGEVLSGWVEEAEDRNLALDDCRKIIFEASTDKKVCRLAVATDGEWGTNPHSVGWRSEAKRRGFTAAKCSRVMLADHSDQLICTYSIRNDAWTTQDLLFVNEAKRRGLSPAKCKSL